MGLSHYTAMTLRNGWSQSLGSILVLVQLNVNLVSQALFYFTAAPRRWVGSMTLDWMCT